MDRCWAIRSWLSLSTVTMNCWRRMKRTTSKLTMRMRSSSKRWLLRPLRPSSNLRVHLPVQANLNQQFVLPVQPAAAGNGDVSVDALDLDHPHPIRYDPRSKGSNARTRSSATKRSSGELTTRSKGKDDALVNDNIPPPPSATKLPQLASRMVCAFIVCLDAPHQDRIV